jgi:fibronectin type 3 domain-containing protein
MRILKSFIPLIAAACVWGLAPAQTCVPGTPGAAPVATLTFAAVTTNTDGTAIAAPVSYNLYQGPTATSLTMVSGTLKPGTGNTISTGLTAGLTYYWAITAVDANGVEGAKSAVVCKSFPKAVPGVTTITIT